MKNIHLILCCLISTLLTADVTTSNSANNAWNTSKQDYYNWVKNDVTAGMPQQQQNEVLNNLKTSLDNNTFNLNDFTQSYNNTLQNNQGPLSSWLDSGGSSSSSLLSSSGSCACSSVIQQGFSDMKSYIVDDKFKKLKAALPKWEQSIDENIAQQKAKNALIKQNIEQNARKSFYLEKLIYQYQKGNQIE